MRKYVVLICIGLMIPLALSSLPSRTGALDGSEFRPGRIIDDSIFTKNGSMSVSGIQDFLDTKVPNCDTQGEEEAFNTGMTRAEYGRQNDNPPPFTCLKNYSHADTGESAAEIIHHAAEEYNINPKVLIVTLEKENSLVTDEWPWDFQYRTAMGFACPDDGSCDPEYFGFKKQVHQAARHFRNYMNDNPDWWIPYRTGVHHIDYHPNDDCGGSDIHIQNRATAALYNYTPYQPNQAALDNLYGTGDDCSSYGNRNFWRLFNDWFGNPTAKAEFTWSITAQEAYLDPERTEEAPYHITMNPGEKVYMRIKAENTGNQVWYDSFLRLGTNNPRDRTSPFQDESWHYKNRVTPPTQEITNPGDVATFDFTITAPDQFGEYKEYYNLVAGGITWLNDHGLYYPITVEPSASYGASLTKSTAYIDAGYKHDILGDTARLTPGEKFYMKVNIKNQGKKPLVQGPARLGTVKPRDRTSKFRNDTWITDDRAATLSEESIETSETGTFRFALTAPESTGEFTEWFGAVVEGTTWIDEDKISQNIKVVDEPQNDLTTWQRLHTWDRIISETNKYKLIMQDDGNLVLRNANGAVVWKTKTADNPDGYLTMQNDGNLVLRDAEGVAIWASNTVGK